VLLAATLRALGVDARLALVRDFGKDPAPTRLARSDVYTRPVLRVRHGGAVYWTDPSQRHAPFGLLPPSARGAEALLVAAPGADAELVRTPAGDGVDPRSIEATIAVAEDGSAIVEGTETYRGWEAAAAKATLERVDADERSQAVEQALAQSFRGVALEALAVEGEGDPAAPVVLRWRARVASFARFEGAHGAAELPLFPARLGAQYASRARRETPLLVATGEDATQRVTVSLPPGWRAVAQPREIDGAHGGLRRADLLRPDGLVREERFTLRRAWIDPAAYPTFAAFANELDAAQSAPLLFEREPPTG
jgi:hypothetical protein